MLYTSLYSFSPSPPDFLVTPSHSLNPLVSDSQFSSQPQFSFFFLNMGISSNRRHAYRLLGFLSSELHIPHLQSLAPKPHAGLYHLPVLHLWNLHIKVPPCYRLSLFQHSLSLNIILLHSDLSSLEATSMNSLISTSFVNQFRFQGPFSYFSSPENCQESVLFSLLHRHLLSSGHHYPSYYLAISTLIFLILILPDLPSSPFSTLWPKWSFHNTSRTKPFPF